MSLVKFERQGRVAVLTLDRPDALNALGAAGDGDDMDAACARVNADYDIKCVILTGAGRAFSAGGDIKAMAAKSGSFAGDAVELREVYRNNIQRLVRAVYGLEVPAIAAVNGPAIGLGCDIACMCDMRIASEAARFGVTFMKIGLIPGDGGAWLLPRTIGMSRACELLFTGDVIDATTAAEWGLVSKVTAEDALMDEALAMAAKVCEMPAHALRLGKQLLRQGQTASFDNLMEMSALAQAISHHTADHHEGVTAAVEKRRPKFAD